MRFYDKRKGSPLCYYKYHPEQLFGCAFTTQNLIGQHVRSAIRAYSLAGFRSHV